MIDFVKNRKACLIPVAANKYVYEILLSCTYFNYIITLIYMF